MQFFFLPDSIVNNASNPRDYDSPYSFLSFIQYQNFKTRDVNIQLKEYQSYINSWASFKHLKKSEERLLVRDAYVNLLREITLNFASAEERRFILNADFNDDSDLDIIIPFFIQKLKQISFYYGEKREDVKNSIIKYNLKGSNFGVESIIKKIIYEYVDNNLTSNREELSSFYENFDVSVSELYSETDAYYDKDANSDHTYTNKIDPNIFINIKQSIIDAISAYPLYLENSNDSILNSFTSSLNLSGDELNYLKNRDFINYVQNGEDDLKINLFKSLYSKYIGTDFYYLSTNSKNETVSGVLFESKNFSGQYLNKHYPTSIVTQSVEKLYSTHDLGGFFVPQNQGILIYNTPKKTYTIDLENISPDKVYVFPDPNKIGNVIYTSDKENENIPITYLIDVEWNRTKISNGWRLNDVLSNNYNQLFYGYQSRQQDVKISTEGIAKVTDNITFWNGDKDQIWKGSFDVNKYPIDKDADDLLLKEGVVVDWYPDEYNNEFSLYKKINSYSKENDTYSIDDGGVIPNSNTTFKDRSSNVVSLYEKKNVNQGKIFVRNNFYNKITNIKDSLSSVFLKYPSYVCDEIEDKCIKLFLIDNIFVIETENYVVSDRYVYDLNSNRFKTGNNQPFYRKKEGINKFLDTFINPWYDEKNNKLFLVFLNTIDNSLSSSNYKYISPEIYGTDLKDLKYKKIYPLIDTYTNVYSLSTPYGDIPEINLIEYCGGSFRKNSFLNEYNLTYMAKNLNSMPFIVNEKLYYKPENDTFVSETPLLLKPFYYYLDNNYSNPKLQYYVKALSNRSGYIGVKDDNSLNLVENIPNKINYAFSSNVDVLQINESGKYIVQFDWQSYNETNIFIGCSSINLRQIEDNILLNFKSNLTYLTAYDEYKFLFKFVVDNEEFNVSVKRPVFPDNEILYFEVMPTNNISFTGTFCGDSIYRKLKITKTGGGFGNVYTDPPCINCGDDCEYLYPINSTITLVASAASRSEFTGWFGDNSFDGQKNDLPLSLSDNKTVIANFDPLPLYKVTVNNDFGGVISLDGEINCEIGSCSNEYFLGTYVTISACPPLKNFIFRRFAGAPCYSGNRMCTFIVYSDLNIDALYSEVLYYDLRVSIQSEFGDKPTILANTIVGERVILINDALGNDDVPLLLTPSPDGQVDWEYQNEPIISTYGTDLVSLSESTFISLTASPRNPGYVFSKWIGGPCDNSTDKICRFELNQSQDIVAYFDLVTYTVTVIFSGGGQGKVFTIPSGINYDTAIADPVSTYGFVSGTNLTLYIDDYAGSTFLSLCSEDIPSTKLTTASFSVTSNITLTAIFIPYVFVDLVLYKYGPNKVLFSTSPISNLDCDLTCTTSRDTFTQGTNVNLIPTYVGGSRILYYDVSEPIINRYYAGTGINLGAPYLDILSNRTNGFILVNNSLIINDASLGAPYAESTLNGNASGLEISYTSIDVDVTNYTEVSAFIVSNVTPVAPTPVGISTLVDFTQINSFNNIGIFPF